MVGEMMRHKAILLHHVTKSASTACLVCAGTPEPCLMMTSVHAENECVHLHFSRRCGVVLSLADIYVMMILAEIHRQNWVKVWNLCHVEQMRRR